MLSWPISVREEENTPERGRKARRGRVTTGQPSQWDGCEGNVCACSWGLSSGWVSEEGHLYGTGKQSMGRICHSETRTKPLQLLERKGRPMVTHLSAGSLRRSERATGACVTRRESHGAHYGRMRETGEPFPSDSPQLGAEPRNALPSNASPVLFQSELCFYKC